MYIYYFKNESSDTFVGASEKKFTNVGQVIKHFEWDDYDGYIAEGYTDEDMPYCEFERYNLDDIIV